MEALGANCTLPSLPLNMQTRENKSFHLPIALEQPLPFGAQCNPHASGPHRVPSLEVGIADDGDR
jgi:hypothetical protein